MLKSFHTKGKIEAGCDEAGRGCLAGPVVAAAVILPSSYKHNDLDDSKKLSLKKRLELRRDIERDAISYGVAEVSHSEIDNINILNASFLAMHRAVDSLRIRPELLLIDGNRFNSYMDLPHECIVKGDGLYLSIAAASILAKTYRDELMENLSTMHPGYGWETNAGYPTLKHREGIRLLGTSPYHRMSFQLLPRQIELFEK